MKKSIVKVLALTLVAVMMCLALVSCGGPAKDPADAKAALDENGYTATKIDNDGLGALALAALSVAGIKDVECVVSGTNSDGEHVTIIYFEDKDAANAEWEDVQAYAEDEKDDEETDWVVKKSGNMIYFGTKAGVKAAK
ncbi:MAG: hypothetical protein IJY39_04160 [Clostridia bacterium]|nr:hypothetical protein [Clostridia bacterium]